MGEYLNLPYELLDTYSYVLLYTCTILYTMYILYPLNGRVLEPAVRTTGHFGGTVLCTMYSVHMNCTISSRWVST